MNISQSSSNYCSSFFFFNYTAPTDIYTLSLHDALPISFTPQKHEITAEVRLNRLDDEDRTDLWRQPLGAGSRRSEEHTSELQSQSNLVCRLLLEKKKKNLSVNH